jgi:D-alanyl-D-alanine dipeptidase
MGMLTAADEAYWLAKERQVVATLVNLADFGFVCRNECFKKGWSSDSRCLAQRAVAEALERARAHLPAGHNFMVVDGWRPWPVQEACARDVERRIRQGHPDWTDEAVSEQLWKMAPPIRVVPRLASHRYGGAVDLTILDAGGRELDMGVPLSYVTGPEAALLYYELRDGLSDAERTFRENRRLLIRSMAAGGFSPYLEEFWHWEYRRNL